MLYLRQSTASQSVVIGPFVSSSDGNTVQTGLTIDAADIRLSKNGGNIVGKNSGGGTHDELGYYTITLDATDTSDVGRLQLMVHEAGALPVYHEFWVLEEATYDALFGITAGFLNVNVSQFGGVNGTFSSGRPEVNTTLIEGSDATNQIRDAVVDDATRIDASALNTASGAIGSDGTGLTEAGGTGDHLTAINLPNQTMDIVGNITGNLSGSVGSVTGAVGSVTGAVGSVTGNVGGNVTGSVGSLATQAKADVNAEVLDVLNVDTFSEPSQGAPPASPTIRQMVHFNYKAFRNKITQTATTFNLFADDATTVDQKATVSDDATTFTRGELASGP